MEGNAGKAHFLPIIDDATPFTTALFWPKFDF
jgi:hypothetical protein